ncbi:hypothetical protein [Marinobacter sp.]|uniref:hypothetical protein n=1 Tax=Marinobacter sp. TaxID=50741 RepID=UPI00384A887B
MTEIRLNPELPPRFFECDNEDLTPEERSWSGKVFIRETPAPDTDNGAVYAVYRLDASTGSGPTRYGVFTDLEQARKKARDVGDLKPIMEFF